MNIPKLPATAVPTARNARYRYLTKETDVLDPQRTQDVCEQLRSSLVQRSRPYPCIFSRDLSLCTFGAALKEAVESTGGNAITHATQQERRGTMCDCWMYDSRSPS